MGMGMVIESAPGAQNVKVINLPPALSQTNTRFARMKVLVRVKVKVLVTLKVLRTKSYFTTHTHPPVCSW